MVLYRKGLEINFLQLDSLQLVLSQGFRSNG